MGHRTVVVLACIKALATSSNRCVAARGPMSRVSLISSTYVEVVEVYHLEEWSVARSYPEAKQGFGGAYAL